jgi:hypothetical protein
MERRMVMIIGRKGERRKVGLGERERRGETEKETKGGGGRNRNKMGMMG